jgi:hypothetical protein
MRTLPSAAGTEGRDGPAWDGSGSMMNLRPQRHLDVVSGCANDVVQVAALSRVQQKQLVVAVCEIGPQPGVEARS